LEEQVKRHDPDRYLCTLLFPDEQRKILMPLLAFNQEIASIAGMVSEPMIGLIRLSWWKESLDEIYAGKSPRNHPVLLALAVIIKQGKLENSWYQGLIAAREKDINKTPFETLGDLYAYCDETSSVLLGVAAKLLGVNGHEHHEAISVIGRAWAIAGLLRAIPFFAKEGRNILPLDMLSAAGVSHEDVLEGKNLEKVIAVNEQIAALKLQHSPHKNIRKLLPPEIRHFSVFHSHAIWWLKRITFYKGDIFDANINRGRFWLLARLWLNSKGK
jgi:phytoene synthase